MEFEHILSLLVCPECGQKFAWHPLESSPAGDSGPHGLLECPRRHRFPVIAGVARFLREPLFSALRQRYAWYFERVDGSLWPRAEQTCEPTDRSSVLLKTVDRFGYEWTRYADYSAENFTRFLEPVRSRLGPGIVALDAGCGAGRHLEALAETGVHVVGVDLSWAVDAAARRTRHHSRFHVIQADILHLPFERATFDVVYSLGVLHHMDDPAAAVATLVRTLRPGGFLLAWVYMRTWRKILLEPVRRLVGAFSPKWIDVIGMILASLEYGLVIGPYAWLCRIGGRPLLPLLVPLRIQEYARLGFRVSRIDWYDRLAAPVSRPMTLDQARALLDLPELQDQAVNAVDDSWWQCFAQVRR